ncbi:PREDICTED: uncharacterized protein LOC104603103 [Nelumbo nucifera]|uniref:Uncharacterized protein LOC104603103 n=2 Tax=Nelumbo nucifera TaxID=4432 RepID=A0A1U8AQW0_NELNU|nr:PREDICTED: uncharacterized protein LOC104603103 [Nelumbo nucifera]DAD31834.1 TPA_asm: hypothetical protein HUJ06_010685 [Nelumbo nucifera]
MPKKRPPIFERALNLLKLSIFMTKMGKPGCPSFIFLSKTRKLKKHKYLRHYNHAFTEEYEFSPSSTPLFPYYRQPFKKRGCRDIYSLFFLCRCSNNWRVDDGGEAEEFEEGKTVYALEAPPAIVDDADDDSLRELPESPLIRGDEEESVDERAEVFIQRFYEEMRLQRQKSVLQYNEMLDRGCS